MIDNRELQKDTASIGKILGKIFFQNENNFKVFVILKTIEAKIIHKKCSENEVGILLLLC